MTIAKPLRSDHHRNHEYFNLHLETGLHNGKADLITKSRRGLHPANSHMLLMHETK